MERGADDWWTVECEAVSGDDYGYSLDGGPALPDPRSPWQPYGVGGLSRLVDHSGFSWTDGAWGGISMGDAVIYELHTGTFSTEGTFGGVAERLDHVASLGANVIELMPVAEFPGDRGWGYDGVNLFAPHHRYGGPGGLKHLVNACHARGIGVIMDVVYNHIGPEGNHLAAFGPYMEAGRSTPWGKGLRLSDPDATEVRNFVIDNACMWIRDYHCDGLRVDAIQALRWEGAIGITREIQDAVRNIGKAQGRKVVLIAEDDINDSSVVVDAQKGGLGFDAVYANTFQRALQPALTGERSGHYQGFGSIAHLLEALQGPWVYAGHYARYLSAQQEHNLRVCSCRFLVYLQNHDQVGNREQGERISSLVSPGLAKIGAALTLLSPFTPMLFQGEEFAASSPFLFFTDHRQLTDPLSIWRSRMEEFADFDWDEKAVPNPQSAASFSGSKLRWEELEGADHAAMLAWYRSLVLLRKELDLTGVRFDPSCTLYDENARWLRVARGQLLIAANLGSAPATIPLTGAPTLRLASDNTISLSGESLFLPPETVAMALMRESTTGQKQEATHNTRQGARQAEQGR